MLELAGLLRVQQRAVAVLLLCQSCLLAALCLSWIIMDAKKQRLCEAAHSAVPSVL